MTIDARTLETMNRLSVALEKNTQALERHTKAIQRTNTNADWLRPVEAAGVLGIPANKNCTRKLKELSDQGFVRRRNTRPPMYNRQDLERLKEVEEL